MGSVLGLHGEALPKAVFCFQVGSTLALVGLIWFVQLVHYPLFFRADPERFAAFEVEHANRTGWIAGPLMIAELLTAACLLRETLRPTGISAGASWVGFGLVLALWASTVFVQIPLHNRLERGFDRQTISRLVATNWVRTVLWTARGGLVLSWAFRLLPR